MFGRELLKKGVIWRVGNGKKIQLIKDRWIQGLGVLKPVINLQTDTTVSYLIDEAKGTWNENLVKECFNPSDAEQILQLPLCHNHCEDFPSWPYTKEGIYSVRSAYNLAKLEGFHKFLSVNGKGESSDMTKIKRVWKRLWMIKAPAKMKIILWRMAHDCLPTRMQLKHRHIPAPYACCFCGREELLSMLCLCANMHLRYGDK